MAGTHEAVAVLGIGAKGMGWQLARCAHDRTAGSLMPGLADGLVWAAPQPDAIMVQLPDRAGRWPAAALLCRGPAALVRAGGSAMTSPPQPEHLNNRHRDTLRQIFRHPVSHNVEWRAVLSLLEAVGTVTVRHDGKVAVTLGPEREFLDPPRGKDIDAQMVMDLRRMLSSAGYRPS